MERIVDAVARFEREQMSLCPTSIMATLQDDALFVMLEGVSPPSEKACAGDSESQELLEHYHARVFAAGGRTLEEELEGILSRSVTRSTLSVDPVSETGVMQFTLGEPSR
ncbi:MAG: DUF2294 family protein [Nitrospiraceae bacterium]|nr:DUF2294 family protein [Nitrospiraceae bacterium]